MTECIQMDGGVGCAISLLGGETTLQAKVLNTADAHELLLKGLPVASVLHLVSKAPCLEDGDALKRSIGVSLAALRRRKGKIPPPRLSCEQSNRCWRFARILGHAIGIFGSEELAAAWMTRPAIGLEHRRPADLLVTYPGTELVEQYLTRIEFGVYT